jgi:hypothetical protein
LLSTCPETGTTELVQAGANATGEVGKQKIENNLSNEDAV